MPTEKSAGRKPDFKVATAMVVLDWAQLNKGSDLDQQVYRFPAQALERGRG